MPSPRKPGPRPRARKPGRPRKAVAADVSGPILEAADALFCERGFDGVSVADVAERAGTTKALVFYYFESKERLFARVVERYYAAHKQALEGALSAGGGFRDRMLAVIDAYVRFMDENGRYARLVQHEVARGAPGRVALIRTNLGQLFDWTARVLGGVLPRSGPLAPRHFFLTVSAAVINYATYAPLLRPLWGRDPASKAAREERRRHIRWLTETLLDAIAAQRTSER